MKHLPNVPSKLLAVAMSDYERTKNDPKFKINMGSWCKKVGSDIPCSVGLAGAVMMQSLESPMPIVGFRGHYPYDFPQYEHHLRALDDLSNGSINYALCELMQSPGISPDLRIKLYDVVYTTKDFGSGGLKVDITPHEIYPPQWEKDMFKLIRRLEGVGL